MIEVGDLIKLNPNGPTVRGYGDRIRVKARYRITEVIPFPHLTVYGATEVGELVGGGICLLAEDIILLDRPYRYSRVGKKTP